jgi:hypothetical protein
MCNNWGSTNSVLQDIIATGNIDTNAVIFDRPSGQVLATLSGHSKKVGLILGGIAGFIFSSKPISWPVMLLVGNKREVCW